MDLNINEFEKRFGVIAKQPAKCEQHGDYIQVIRKDQEPSGCPVCREEARKDEERAKKQFEFMYRHQSVAGIPKRYQNKGFSDYEVRNDGQQQALEQCCDYVDNFYEHARVGRCLLMLGKVGTGKTHLATAIANTLMKDHMVTAVYRTVGGIISGIRGTYDGAEGSEHEIIRLLTHCRLLILDEVGATKATEFEQSILFKIINGRYEQCLPTVVISNLAAKDLPAMLGERCVDRLRENGGIAVTFDWGSARKEIRA